MALSEQQKLALNQKIDGILKLVQRDKGWKRDLSEGLKTLELTPEQIESLKNSATVTLRQLWEHSSFDTVITHAFQDSIGKAIFPIQIGGTEELTAWGIVHLKQEIEKTSRNYRMILKDQMPKSMSDILEFYENEILPFIDSILPDIQDIPLPDFKEGIDSFAPLPENW